MRGTLRHDRGTARANGPDRSRPGVVQRAGASEPDEIEGIVRPDQPAIGVRAVEILLVAPQHDIIVRGELHDDLGPLARPHQQPGQLDRSSGEEAIVGCDELK